MGFLANVGNYVFRNLKYGNPKNWRAGTKAIYRRLSKSGVLFDVDDLGMASLLPKQKISKVIELVNPVSILDVGCGTGATLAEFRSLGIDAVGVEASEAALQTSLYRDHIILHDLRYPLEVGRRFDLVWCFEVAEHIHPRHVETFLDSLVRHSSVIAISAARPGQGGEGHFNEQPASYWIEKFSARGYGCHVAWTGEMQSVKEFYSENMLMFVSAKR